MTKPSRLLTIIVPLLLAAVPLQGARAAASQWTETPGARIRLLVDTSEIISGTMKGAIEIDLKPGWKTYWKEPGDTGVPPSLDLSKSTNITDTELAFPAPKRHDEAGMSWVGYESPVSFPVTMRLADPGKAAKVEGSLFIGVCHDICVPAQAEFNVDVTPGAADPLARVLVSAAYARLPAAASAEFGIVSAKRNEGKVVFHLRLPDPAAPADLFVSGGDGLMFATPEHLPGGADGAAFAAAVTGGTHEKDGKPVTLFYTITQSGRSVSGEISAQ